jgi:hypothetical protein
MPPSVTGEGDDMFASFGVVAAARCCFHSIPPLFRSTDHRWSSPFSATFKKMRSPQMMAVDPTSRQGQPPRNPFGLRPFDGQVGSALRPLANGPRQAGQFCARRSGHEKREHQCELHGKFQRYEHMHNKPILDTWT